MRNFCVRRWLAIAKAKSPVICLPPTQRAPTAAERLAGTIMLLVVVDIGTGYVEDLLAINKREK